MGDAKQQRLRLWRSRGSHSLASSLEAAMQSTEIIIVGHAGSDESICFKVHRLEVNVRDLAIDARLDEQSCPGSQQDVTTCAKDDVHILYCGLLVGRKLIKELGDVFRDLYA
jgi:hypothetical protein